MGAHRPLFTTSRHHPKIPAAALTDYLPFRGTLACCCMAAAAATSAACTAAAGAAALPTLASAQAQCMSRVQIPLSLQKATPQPQKTTHPGDPTTPIAPALMPTICPTTAAMVRQLLPPMLPLLPAVLLCLLLRLRQHWPQLNISPVHVTLPILVGPKANLDLADIRHCDETTCSSSSSKSVVDSRSDG